MRSVTAHACYTWIIIEGVEYHPFVFCDSGGQLKENKFQAGLIKEIKETLVDVVILKNDSSYQQGIPDLLILSPGGWAVLEAKKSLNEPFQPNQEYFLELLGSWSFAAMICPENKREVLNALYEALDPR